MLLSREGRDGFPSCFHHPDVVLFIIPMIFRAEKASNERIGAVGGLLLPQTSPMFFLGVVKLTILRGTIRLRVYNGAIPMNRRFLLGTSKQKQQGRSLRPVFCLYEYYESFYNPIALQGRRERTYIFDVGSTNFSYSFRRESIFFISGRGSCGTPGKTMGYEPPKPDG